MVKTKVILISVRPGHQREYFEIKYVMCVPNRPPERMTTAMHAMDELDAMLKFQAEGLHYGYEVEIGEGDGADTAG
jgi:hypothetical protein